jgi:hypothetical protein
MFGGKRMTDTWMTGIARFVEGRSVGGQRRGEFGDRLGCSSSHGEGEGEWIYY